MPLTAAQKLTVRKHMDTGPNNPTFGPYISALEDAGVKEAELLASLISCDLLLAVIYAVETEADELTEGGGAKFSYQVKKKHKLDAYGRERGNMARILGVDLAALGGGGSQAIGWQIL